MDRLLKAKVDPGCVAVHWLGQGGFVLKAHAGDVVIVDPYLSDSANRDGTSPRLADIPVRPKDVRLNYLFLTHDHLDHTDPLTAPAIAGANPEAVVVCPPSSCHHLVKLGVPTTQLVTAMPGQAIEFPNFVAHVVAAQHTEDSVGYVFEFNDGQSETDSVTVYITGDTEFSDSLAAAVADLGPDLLIIPIDGRPGNLNAEQAARLAAEIAPREVIPMHYGMFETGAQDADEFVACLASATGSDPTIEAVVMKHNQCHIFHPAADTHGKHAQKKARSQRARVARLGHEHKDGVRGPNSSGINRGAGRSH